MNHVSDENKGKYDFCLVSLWNEPVFVNPLYNFTRTAINKITAPIISKKLFEINPNIAISEDEKSVLRYQIKYPCAPALLALAAVLEEKYRVCIISLDVEREQTDEKDWIEAITSKIVGKTKYGILISFVSTEITQLMQFTSTIKKINKDMKVVIGGVHATYNDYDLLQYEYIDYVVRNEGEQTIMELCDALACGKDVVSIDGLSYKHDRKIEKNKDRPFINLEQLPLPAYHLVEKFINKIVLTTMFSRGCPYQCAYCAESAFWTSNVRYKNTEKFVDELELLCNLYNQHFIHIADSTFGVSREKLIELCDELEKRQINAFFSINIRPNVFQYMGENLLRRLKKLNFVELYMGVESADTDVIQSLNRLQGDDLFTVLRKLKIIGFPFVKLYLMIGTPFDSRKSFEKTVNLIETLLDEELIFYATCKYFVPSIGSPIYSQINSDISLHDVSYRLDRYNSPPAYVPNETIAQEMDLYLQMIQVVQYKFYYKKSDIQMQESMKLEWEKFVSRNYLRGHYF